MRGLRISLKRISYLLVLGSGKAGRRFDGSWNGRRRELFFSRALAQALVDPKSVIPERVDQERAEYREPPGSPDP